MRRAALWVVPVAAALCLGQAFWVAALRGSTLPTTMALPVNVHMLTAPGYHGHARAQLAPLSARIIADARHDATPATASPAPSLASGSTVPTPSASASPTGSAPSPTANPLPTPTGVSVPPTPTSLPLPTPTPLPLPTPTPLPLPTPAPLPLPTPSALPLPTL